MKTIKIVLVIKWYKNDNGGDRRCIAIDYENSEDLKNKKNKILNDFKSNPMDINMSWQTNKIGEIPYSVKFEN